MTDAADYYGWLDARQREAAARKPQGAGPSPAQSTVPTWIARRSRKRLLRTLETLEAVGDPTERLVRTVGLAAAVKDENDAWERETAPLLHLVLVNRVCAGTLVDGRLSHANGHPTSNDVAEWFAYRAASGGLPAVPLDFVPRDAMPAFGWRLPTMGPAALHVRVDSRLYADGEESDGPLDVVTLWAMAARLRFPLRGQAQGVSRSGNEL